MSPTDFSKLMNKRPQLSDALGKIRGWLEMHSGEPFLDPRRLTRELPGVSPVTITAALTALAIEGALRPAFKVIGPNHVLADGEFESIDAVLKSGPIRDTDEDTFNPRDAEVLQVFLVPQ